MATRLHRLGSIYSRICGLIRKGHMKDTERPLWFDVYKNFPPKYEPTFKRKAPDLKVIEIFYKEDVLRAKINKAFGDRAYLIDLNSDAEMPSQRWLKKCQQYVSEGLSEDEAVEKLKLSVKNSQESPSSESRAKTKKDVGKLLSEVL